MLTKLSTFRGVTEEGEPLVRLFRQGDNIEKVAGVMMPEVQDWLGGYKSDLKKIALLVNAMCGSEYWGQNSNGDVFPWQALRYDSRTHPMPWPVDDWTGRGIPPYGYRTFLDAHPFVHHRNKDPSRAFGNVVVTCLNPKMKRVELVVLIDRDLAKKFDAGHVVQRIDEGEYPDVSMGCRVPYDVCTICGHKSRTRNDYCSCIRELGMGRLLDDGRRIGVINLYPRFFDISFVFIGADKTAKVMSKLGSVGAPQSILDAEQIYQWEEDEDAGLVKAASAQVVVPDNIVNITKSADVTGIGTSPVEEANTNLDHPTPETRMQKLLKEAPWMLSEDEKNRISAERDRDDHGPGGMSDGFLRTNYGTGTETSKNIDQEMDKGAAFVTFAQLHEAARESQDEEKLKRLAEQFLSNQQRVVSSETPEETRVKTAYDMPGQSFKPGQYEISGTSPNFAPALKGSLGKYSKNLTGSTKDVEPLGETSSRLNPEVPRGGSAVQQNPLMKLKKKLGSASKEECERGGGTWEDGRCLMPNLGVRVGKQSVVKQVEDPQDDELPNTGSGGTGDEGVVGGVNTKGVKMAGMPFLEQDRPAKVKEIYKALKRDHPNMPAEVKARIAGRKGKKSPQSRKAPEHGGPKHKAPFGYVHQGGEKWKKAGARLEKLKELRGMTDEQLDEYVNRSNLARFMDQDRARGFMSAAIRNGQMLKQAGLSTDKDTTAKFEVKGHPDVVERLKKLLAATQTLGNWGSSRTIKFPVDGDGPEGLTVVKGLDGKKPGNMSELTGTGDDFHASSVKWEGEEKSTDPMRATKEAAEKKLQAPPHREEYPFHGKYKFRGLTILVENAKGTWRTGKGWKTKMKNDYGEIEGSLGSDGDPVDVYVGSVENAPNVYIVHQNHAFGSKKGQYDEDKVMLGFADARSAKKAYLAHYDSTDFFRSITEMPFEQFKREIFRKENQGEKLAELAKSASANLEDLFFGAQTAGRRRRMWKNMETGHSTHHVGSGLGDSFSTLAKTASTKAASSKAASHVKVGDIDKEVEPSGTVGRVSAALTGKEPSIPPAILDTMSRCSLQEALATPSMMGMSLKPEEFQRLLLSSAGMHETANDLGSKGIVFSPTSGCQAPCGSLGRDHFSSEIMRALLPLLEQRSYLSPVLVRRVTKVSITPPGDSKSVTGESPLLTKVGDAYNWYRREMAKVAAKYSGDAVMDEPKLAASVFGQSDADVFFAKEADYRPQAVMATVPLALMYSSSIRGDMETGRDPGLLKRLVAEHPFLAALGAAALTKRVLYAQGMQRALERASQVAKGAKGALSLASEGASLVSRAAKAV